MWKTWCVFRVKTLFSNFSDPVWSDWMSFSFRHANFLLLISSLSHRHKKAEIVLIKSPNFSDMYDDDEKQLIDSIEKDFKNISPVALPGSVMWHNAGCQVIARISEKPSELQFFDQSQPGVSLSPPALFAKPKRPWYCQCCQFFICSYINQRPVHGSGEVWGLFGGNLVMMGRPA